MGADSFFDSIGLCAKHRRMSVQQVFILLGIFAAMCTLRGDEVSLYLSPARAAEPFMTLEKDHPLLERLQAVPDEEQAAAGWEWIEINGKYRGFVRASDIGKALRVQENATVYQKADAGSTVMTTILADDKVELTELLDEWGSIIFEKKIPLFANNSLAVEQIADQEVPVEAVVDDAAVTLTEVVSESATASATTVVEVTESPVEIEEEVSVLEETAPQTLTVEVKEIAEVEEVIESQPSEASEPIVQEIAPKVTEVIQEEPTAITVTGGIPEGTPTESKISRDFFGILKSYSGGIFRSSKYQYKLVDRKGKIIALVDFDKVVLSQSLGSYLNQPIRVRGTYLRPADENRLVIIARNIYQIRQ